MWRFCHARRISTEDCRSAPFGGAAWAHDWFSNLAVTPSFLAPPGASFVVNGAPARRVVSRSAGRISRSVLIRSRHRRSA
jgi:hypothetical protein